MASRVGFDLTRQQAATWHSDPSSSRVRVHLRVPIGDRDAAEVVRRLAAAAARHEILRTTFTQPAGMAQPVQVVQDECTLAGEPDQLSPDTGPTLRAVVTTGDEGSRWLELEALRLVADVVTLELLAAEALGDSRLNDDPIQYAEYAAWQLERLEEHSSEESTAAAAAWQRLRAASPSTSLVALPEAPGAGIAHRLDPAAAVAVADLAHTADVAPRSIWLAAWVALLHWQTGNDVISLGVELDPRVDPELAGAAGPYARVVPLSVAVAPDLNFGDLAVALDRDLQVAGRYLEWAPTGDDMPVLFSSGSLHGGQDRDGLQAELRVDVDGAGAEVRADPQRLPAPDTASIVASLQRLVITATLDTAVADLDLLDDAGREALLNSGRGPAPTADLVPVITQIVEQASRTPDRTAVTDGERSLSYRELLEHISTTAAALRSAGAITGSPVAMVVPRSVDSVVALLAIQHAGCGYLPLDVDGPPARSAQQLQAAACTIAVASGAAAVAGLPDGLVIVDLTGSPSPAPPQSPAVGSPSLDDLAYVIFTSGSTGTPRGVSITHRSLANYVAAVAELVGPADAERQWAMVTSFTTDLGHTALFPSLATGGTLHIVPTETARDPARFGAYCAQHGIDVLKIAPSHLDALLTDPAATVLPREALILGGEAVSWSLLDHIASRRDCRVINHYGPSETTVGALVYAVPDDPGGHRSRPTIPIGRPIGGADAFVVDRRHLLVPAGAVGELAIGGAGVAAGYCGDSDRTAERFVAHPAGRGRLYLTGDRVRRLSDGVVEFLGRADGQVKIRGYRIERGEIEAALRQHPAVQRAAVLALDAGTREARLVGYVVSQVNPNPTAAELRAHLARLLPEPMIPARYLEIDELPLLGNGKLDEASLVKLASSVDRSGPTVLPATDTELQVAATFAEVLGLDSVGVTDDFFSLGGHSLLAVHVTATLREILNIELPVYALFESPTVRELATAIDAGVTEDVSDGELRSMIEELAQLSDEEAASLLSAESSGNDRP